MKLVWGFLVVAALAFANPALGQSPATVKLCIPTSPTSCVPVTASAPLPITGSFSATLAGFTPNGNYTTLTATAASSASTALPAGTVVAFQNLSTVDVSCVLSAGAATATTNKLIVRGGATVYYTVDTNVNAACINQTGSASNVIGLAGGAGLGTAFGGGGSGGGGGAVTVADGADVAQGAIADAAVTAGATGTVNAHLRSISRDVMTVNTWAGSTLGAITTYGSTPGAVLVPSANVFVTNTQAAVGNNVDNVAAGASAASPVANYNYAFDGTTWDRVRTVNVDPCEANAQTYATGVITTATTTRIVAPSASNKTYACMFFTKASAADNVAVVEGTGGTCGTGTAAVLGGTTTANGLVYTAGDGLLLQAGGKVAAMQTAGTNVDLCLITSTTGPLIYAIKFVQAP
jgi:hypothetical protein